MTRATTGVVLAAGGSGTRYGGKKQFLELEGRPLFFWSLDAFASVSAVRAVAVVVPAGDEDRVEALVERWRRETGRETEVSVVVGGARRQDSVRRGLRALPADCREVLVHDAARPLIRTEDIAAVVTAIGATGAAALGHQATDSIKEAEDHRMARGLDRSLIWQVQTPQGARRVLLERAYELEREGERSLHTDEASLLEAAGIPVLLVPGARDNLKVTEPGDLPLAAFLLARRRSAPDSAEGDPSVGAPPRLPSLTMWRVGLGTDNHRLVEGRKLWVGGVEIPAPVGEDAHSDGDVLLHALTDAILGAVGEGDIGEHFPDRDPRWKDQPSDRFLRHAAELAASRGWRMVNVDATVTLESIRLSPHKRGIEQRIREILEPVWALDAGAVNVKAKTNERCDAVGEGRAIAAMAIVLLERISDATQVG